MRLHLRKLYLFGSWGFVSHETWGVYFFFESFNFGESFRFIVAEDIVAVEGGLVVWLC